MEVSLDRQVRKYRQAAFADSTKTAYRSQLNKYLDFCREHGLQPVPACTQTVCRYIADLAQSMRPVSIKQYLNVIRLLHLEHGLDNPLENSFVISSVLKGVQRVKGDFIKRVLPITPDILLSVLSVLDVKQSQNAAFWAAALVAFYGMMRKSSLFATRSPNHMCLGNCTMHSWGLEIRLDYSKTIQFQERQVYVALPWNGVNLKLCPVTAVINSLKLSHCCQADDFLFTYVRDGGKHRLTYGLFTSMLKHTLVSVNLPVDQYSGHSLRRGGATLALQKGVPSEIIQAQGDWKSLAYLDYIDQSSSCHRAKLVSNMFL